MSTELEHRLVDLGSWLDQAAPEVQLREFAARMTVADEEPMDGADLEAPVLLERPRHARHGRVLGAAAAAVLVLVAGLVAVSRRSGTSGTQGSTAIETPSTTAAAATLGAPWLALVTPLLPGGFTAVATLSSPGPLLVAMDGAGRTITVTFEANGAETARREWEGMAGVTLTAGVAGGDGSSAVVVTAAGDAIGALCWLGDDLCSAASIDPPVDVRPLLEALGRAVTDANRQAITESASTSVLDGARASAVFGRFGTELGKGFTLSTSGGVVARQSWTRPANATQRVSLQIVPDDNELTIVDVARTDLVTVTVQRDRVLYTAVSRTTDGTPAMIGAGALRDLLVRSIDDAAAGSGSVTTSTLPAVAQPALPPLIDALFIRAGDLALAQNALHRSAGGCMRAKGLPYAVAPFADRDVGLGWMGEWFGTGLTVQQASVSGYHEPVGTYDAAAADRFEQATAENTAHAQSDEAYAHESEVCALAANKAVFEDDADPFLSLQTSTENALIAVLAPARASAGYQQALDTWRTCARSAGVDDDTPRGLLPFGTAVGAPPTAPATPDERERAVADARCREEAHLQDALRSAAVQLLDTWLAGRPGLVERLQQGKARSIERAQRILADTAATLKVVGTVTLPDGAQYGVGISDTAFCLTTGDGTVSGCDGAPASLSPAHLMVGGYGSGSDQLLYGVADTGLTARVLSGGAEVASVQSREAIDGHTVFMAIIPSGTRVDVELRKGSETVKRFDNVPH